MTSRDDKIRRPLFLIRVKILLNKFTCTPFFFCFQPVIDKKYQRIQP